MAQQQGGGGSFLRTALTTAAGVAGGALLFQGIRSLFGHGSRPLADQRAPVVAPAADSLSSDIQQAGGRINPSPTNCAASDYDSAGSRLTATRAVDDWACSSI